MSVRQMLEAHGFSCEGKDDEELRGLYDGLRQMAADDNEAADAASRLEKGLDALRSRLDEDDALDVEGLVKSLDAATANAEAMAEVNDRIVSAVRAGFNDFIEVVLASGEVTSSLQKSLDSRLEALTRSGDSQEVLERLDDLQKSLDALESRIEEPMQPRSVQAGLGFVAAPGDGSGDDASGDKPPAVTREQVLAKSLDGLDADTAHQVRKAQRLVHETSVADALAASNLPASLFKEST